MIRIIFFVILFITIKLIKECEQSRCESHSCELTPEETRGPLYEETHLSRIDIRESQIGVKLEIKLKLEDVSNCKPLPNVGVELYNVNAYGYYGGFLGISPDKPNTAHNPNPLPPTDNSTFLRGLQISDTNGEVRFVTIFPGWYYHRCVHIHVECHYENRLIHSGTLYFEEDITEQVVRLWPYSTHRLQRYRNNQDCFYNREGGKLTLMNAQPINGMNIKDGLRAHLSMRLDTRNNLFGNETPSNCLYIDF